MDSGSYNLHIKDATGCISVHSVFIDQEPRIRSVSVGITPDTCGKQIGTIQVAAVIGANAVQFTFNGTSNASGNFNALSTSTNNLRIADENGCFYDTLITIPEIPGPTQIQITGTQPDCDTDNGQLVLQGLGGTAPYQYNVNSGGFSSQSTYSNLAPGIYTIEVQDAAGCSFSMTHQLNTKDAPVLLDLHIQAETCERGNGSISVQQVVGGTAPYQYSFGGGGYNAANSVAGLSSQPAYPVQLLDDAGCRLDTTVQIPAVLGPSVVEFTIKPDTCSQSTGLVSVFQVTGGSVPYQYNFNGAGFSGADRWENLATGNYPVSVQDNNGCDLDTVVGVGIYSGISDFDVQSEDVLCNVSLGQIEVLNIVGGVAPYQYQINGGALVPSPIFNNLSAGNYNITVWDNSGCSFTEAVVIDSIRGPENVALFLDAPHCGMANGQIEVTSVSGGQSPYQYGLNSGSFNSQNRFENLSAGNYEVRIKDNQGCIVQFDTNLIDIPGPYELELSASPEFCDHADGSITITQVNGGTSPYTFSLNGALPQSNSAFTNLSAGSFDIAVLDAAGCSFQHTNYNLEEKNGPEDILAHITNTTCNLLNGKVELMVQDAVQYPPYSFTHNNETQVDGILDSLASGLYPIEITDGKGCTVIYNAEVRATVLPRADFQFDNTDPVAPAVVNTTNQSANATNYQWLIDGTPYSTNELAVFSFNDTAEVIVSLIANPGSACPDTLNKILRIHPPITIFVPNSFSPNGDGVNETFGAILDESGIYGYEMQVFNRWGELIFSSETPSEHWDGKFKGKRAPAGMYSWQINYTIKGKELEVKNLSGSLMLIR